MGAEAEVDHLGGTHLLLFIADYLLLRSHWFADVDSFFCSEYLLGIQFRVRRQRGRVFGVLTCLHDDVFCGFAGGFRFGAHFASGD